ncbi:serpin family protein [Oceanobacillus jeddahense]|uniref:Serpin family protein n=1 Tax=Oceanobacillus jeddahense TaxID=1462527 RepID=A0ABY5JUQ1_9BACI|nr:serpin family protein [Oceanobacillus jeddahense]UUI02801.1 serpin family protein [Oceanobacillus jeddahense]
MMKKIFCICIVIFLTACNSSNSGEENPADNVGQPDDASKETVRSGLNQLGFETLSGLDKNEDGNLFISPVSIWTALNMTYHGADGETKAEMEKVLGLENMDTDALFSANHALLTEQAADDEGLELYLANAVWFREDIAMNDAYQEALKTYYLAQIEPLTTADAINDWVAEQTNDKIDTMVDDISPDLLLFLLNAVYFQGDWTHPFDENLTEEQEFHLADGSSIEIPTMVLHEEDLNYWEDDHVQVVSLPYEEEETIQMQIFLPNEDTSFSEFQEDFSLEKWQEWTDALEHQTGTVSLPSFTLEYESELNELFIELGMEQAYDPNQADLSKMFEETEDLDAYISKIFHKTFIDVNEEGTEAAGATSTEIEVTSAPLEETFTMEINRPFLFTITNTEEDIILFMGSIEQPVNE